jgi:hypothetical protein
MRSCVVSESAFRQKFLVEHSHNRRHWRGLDVWVLLCVNKFPFLSTVYYTMLTIAWNRLIMQATWSNIKYLFSQNFLCASCFCNVVSCLPKERCDQNIYRRVSLSTIVQQIVVNLQYQSEKMFIFYSIYLVVFSLVFGGKSIELRDLVPISVKIFRLLESRAFSEF